jgi:hypothetical protein
VTFSWPVLVSWTAVLTGAIAAAAQYRRLTNLGVEGVSTATWMLFTLNNAFWIVFGALSAHSFAVVMGSLVAWPWQIAIVIRLAPWRRRLESIKAIAMFIATCVAPGVIGGWSYGVYGVGLSMTLLRGPQFMRLLRIRDASGVSSASWFIGAGCSALWISYYADIHLLAPLIATAASGGASLVIASMALWRHRQCREDLACREMFAT